MGTISRPGDMKQSLALNGAQNPAKGGRGVSCTTVTGNQKGFSAQKLQHLLIWDQKLAPGKAVTLPLVKGRKSSKKVMGGGGTATGANAKGNQVGMNMPFLSLASARAMAANTAGSGTLLQGPLLGLHQ